MTKKVLNKKDILHVADLIKIHLNDDEIDKYEDQLNTVVESLSVLDEVDVSKTDITAQVTSLKNIFREDEVEDSLSQDDALSNTQSKKKGYFVVKRVI